MDTQISEEKNELRNNYNKSSNQSSVNVAPVWQSSNHEKPQESSNCETTQTRHPKIISYWDVRKTMVEKRRPSGTLEYNLCPSLTEKQQCLSEFALPFSLPSLFYLLNLSPFALQCCYIMIVIHTIETMVTNFGASVTNFCALKLITPLTHHFLDCIWLHSLISVMLLVPAKFSNVTELSDPRETIKVMSLGLMLIQTLPIYLSVSFKTHYLKNRYQDTRTKLSMNNLIHSCFSWYWVATILISFVGLVLKSFILLLPCVMILNIIPILLINTYWENSKQQQNKSKRWYILSRGITKNVNNVHTFIIDDISEKKSHLNHSA